jgi:hypothetical protein
MASKKRRRPRRPSTARLACLAAALLLSAWWWAGPLARYVGYHLVCGGSRSPGPCPLLALGDRDLRALGLAVQPVPVRKGTVTTPAVSFRGRRVGCEREVTLGGSSAPGGAGRREGSWTLCLDDPTLASRMRAGACVVYSFGVRDDLSFEATISRMGCRVWAFDPNVPDIGPARDILPNVRFEPAGIARAGATTRSTASGARLLGLGDIMRRLGHARVDVLKLDVEGNEWPVLGELASSFSDGSVSQLLAEVHFSMLPADPEEARGLDEARMVGTLRALRRAGWRMWRREENEQGYERRRSFVEGRGSCCYDTAWVWEGSAPG